MFDFESFHRTMVGQTVLCVGDLMLDEFVYGEVSRISPEAPAPVIAARRSETNIGGAGNVARNIASLGAKCIFVGLIGEDAAGAELKAALAQGATDREHSGHRSRAADDAQGAFRFRTFPHPYAAGGLGNGRIRPRQRSSNKLIDTILPLIPRADIVLLSDYAKGVLTARVIRNVIDAARKARQSA